MESPSNEAVTARAAAARSALSPRPIPLANFMVVERSAITQAPSPLAWSVNSPAEEAPTSTRGRIKVLRELRSVGWSYRGDAKTISASGVTPPRASDI